MVTIDYGNTNYINIPQSFLSLLSGSVYQLDTNAMRFALKDLEASEEGIVFTDTHIHNTEIIISNISYARSIIILNPYRIEFEDGLYGVTLLGSNNNILDVNIANQVSVLGNNSAGLINSEAVNNQSFLGGNVYIDTTGGGFSGTLYPIGTPSKESDNYTDAREIANVRGFDSFILDGTLTLNPADDTMGTNWRGKSPIRANLILNGSDTTSCEIQNLALSGQASGFMAIRDCRISNLTNFRGTIRDSLLQGSVTLDNTATGSIIIAGSTSGVAGASRFMLDCNSSNLDVQIRNYTGGIEIENFNQGNNMSIDVHSGTVELKPTCTNGIIVVRGVVQLIDNSGAGCTVITEGTVTELTGSNGGGGSSPWTEAEKNKVIQDVEDSKNQAAIAALNTQSSC